SYQEWLDRYADALYRASQTKHPQRKQPRSYPRKAHFRRPKTTKFQKSQSQMKGFEDDSSPPTETK
ncbi:MAG: IS4 family transposase, partial [Pirellulaceae bacterium]